MVVNNTSGYNYTNNLFLNYQNKIDVLMSLNDFYANYLPPADPWVRSVVNHTAQPGHFIPWSNGVVQPGHPLPWSNGVTQPYQLGQGQIEVTYPQLYPTAPLTAEQHAHSHTQPYTQCDSLDEVPEVDYINDIQPNAPLLSIPIQNEEIVEEIIIEEPIINPVHAKKGAIRRFPTEHHPQQFNPFWVAWAFLLIIIVAVAIFLFYALYNNRDQNNSYRLAVLFRILSGTATNPDIPAEEATAVVIFLIIATLMLGILWWVSYETYRLNFDSSLRYIAVLFLFLQLLLIGIWVGAFFNESWPVFGPPTRQQIQGSIFTAALILLLTLFQSLYLIKVGHSCLVYPLGLYAILVVIILGFMVTL